MARVKVTRFRIVYQFMDAAGHRLPAKKGGWQLWEPWDPRAAEADCPKCPEPEPEPEPQPPEPVECGSWWHRIPLDDLQNSSITYCPTCGKRLREA